MCKNGSFPRSFSSEAVELTMVAPKRFFMPCQDIGTTMLARSRTRFTIVSFGVNSPRLQQARDGLVPLDIRDDSLYSHTHRKVRANEGFGVHAYSSITYQVSSTVMWVLRAAGSFTNPIASIDALCSDQFRPHRSLKQKITSSISFLFRGSIYST